MRAALGEPGGQREQRRGARADAEQQAGGRVAGHRERAAERPDHVQHVTGAAVRQPLGARLARQEDELHRAAVVGPHVVDRRTSAAPSMPDCGPPTAIAMNWPGRNLVAIAGATTVMAT